MSKSKGIQIWELFHELFRNKPQHQDQMTLTQLETRVVYIISKYNKKSGSKASVSIIKSKLNVSSPTISQVIRNLVEKGLVEKVQDEKDKRVTRLILSKKGIETLSVAFHNVENEFVKIANHLGDEKSDQFIAIMTDIVDYLKKTGE